MARFVREREHRAGEDKPLVIVQQISAFGKLTPAYVDKPVMAKNSGFKGKLTYSAKITIDFPIGGLNSDEKVTLIVKPPDGLGPAGSRNASFKMPFDLASVK